jgi:hypothetical protein
MSSQQVVNSRSLKILGVDISLLRDPILIEIISKKGAKKILKQIINKILR